MVTAVSVSSRNDASKYELEAVDVVVRGAETDDVVSVKTVNVKAETKDRHFLRLIPVKGVLRQAASHSDWLL